jgi:pimeloyl-ACP methyl ester carboxylesterase
MAGSAPTYEERSSSIRLGDRTLAYAELGDPGGTPVVVLDGPCSRGLARALDALGSAPGVRLIAPDRPGSTYTGFVPELAALLGALDVDRVGLVAQSGGTAFALAFAAAAPERVRGLGLIGPMAPVGSRAALGDYGKQLRVGLRLVRRAPWLLRLVLGRMGKQAANDPAAAARQVVKDLPPADRAMLEEPALWELHERTTAEVLTAHEGVLREMDLMARPWGFDLAGVRVPVEIWVGEHDERHPAAVSRRLAAALPGDVRVHVVPGASTFAMAPVYPDVVRFALGG